MRGATSVAVASALIVSLATCDYDQLTGTQTTKRAIDVRVAVDTVIRLADSAQVRLMLPNGNALPGGVRVELRTNNANVTVDSAGRLRGAHIGSVTLTARVLAAEMDTAIERTAQLRVRYAGIVITRTQDASTEIDSLTGIGETRNITVRGTDIHGAVAEPVTGSQLSFASLDPNVIRVSSSGVLTAIAPGTTRITASFDGLQDTTTVRVRPVAASIVFAQTEFVATSLGVNVSAPVPTVRDTKGVPIAAPSIQWSTTDTTVASVSTAGALRMRRLGTTVLTARMDTVAASVPIRTVQAVASLEAKSGGGLTDTVGHQLPQLVSVRVLDAGAFPIPAQTVHFAVATGGGTITDTVAVTDSAGVASAGAWTLGTRATTNQVTATVAGQLLTLAAIAVADAPDTISVDGGAGQATTASTPLSAPLRVRVSDRYGNPVAGALVRFVATAAGAAVLPRDTVRTAADGMAQVTAVLGPLTGAQTFEATVDGMTLPPAVFPAEAIAAHLAIEGAAATVRSFDTLPRLHVGSYDEGQKLVGGDTVTVTLGIILLPGDPGSPNAALHGVTQRSLVNGIATFDSLSVDSAGTYHVVATASDRIADTSASIVVMTGRPMRLRIGTPMVDATAGDVLPTLAVSVLDTLGRLTTADTQAVSLVLADGPTGATLIGTVDTVAVDGVASFPGVQVWKAGSGYRIVATAPGLTPDTTAIFAVAAGAPASVAITPGSIGFAALGDAQPLAATVLDAFGNPLSMPVSWVSSDTSVVSVSSAGIARAVANGTATITASADTAKGTAAVTVHQAAALIAASPDTIRFTSLGETHAYIAAAQDANGHTLPDSLVQWSSLDTTVVTVAPSGEATAQGNGVARIVARSGASADTVVALVAQDVASVEVTDSAAVMVVGRSHLFVAEARDANGHAVSGATVTWASRDELVATVGGGGLVTGASVGSTWIVASAAGFTDSVALSVEAALGSVRISSSTTGTNAFADAYLVTVGGRTSLMLPGGSGIVMDSVAPGAAVPVTIGGVPANCTVASSSPGTLDVVDGDTTALDIAVTCANDGSGFAPRVAVDSATACAIVTTGRLDCWGDNRRGQVGIGTVDQNAHASPVAVAGPAVTFTDVAAVGGTTCALGGPGDLYCWGLNALGSLAEDTALTPECPIAGPVRYCRSTPTKMASPALFVRLAGSCGLTASGAAYCWGPNAYGQIGDGTTQARFAPTAVSTLGGSLPRFVSISGDSTVCALAVNGDAYCWGRNSSGELGTGDFNSHSTPTLVGGGFRWRSIRVGSAFVCGVTLDGAGMCWGNNDAGQLGIGVTGGTYPTPQLVVGSQQWTIIVPHHNACGIDTAGAAFCWGAAYLGNDTPDASNVPLPVSGALSYRGVFPGGGFTNCGITDSYGAYCWGSNGSWMIGNGVVDTTQVYLTPTPTNAPQF